MQSNTKNLFTRIGVLLQYERNRFIKKGLINNAIAFTLLFCVIYGAWNFGNTYWPQQIEDQVNFTISWSFVIHFGCLIAYFLIYLPGYLNVSSFYQKYRINPGLSKPWQRKNWQQMKIRTIKFLLINYCIMYPLLIFASMKVSGIKVRFHDFPSPWQIAGQLIFVAFVEDFFFYWAHRLTHQIPFLYKFHKIHHQYDSLYTFVTQYTHPVDYFLGVLLPSAMPFIFLGGKVHCFMFFFWQVWKMFVSTQGHCGYQFPWSPTRAFFFVSGPSYHDFHHSKNVGNFAGSIYIWDTINNSNQLYFNQYYKDLQTIKCKK